MVLYSVISEYGQYDEYFTTNSYVGNQHDKAVAQVIADSATAEEYYPYIGSKISVWKNDFLIRTEYFDDNGILKGNKFEGGKYD